MPEHLQATDDLSPQTAARSGAVDALGDNDLDMLPVADVVAIGADAVPPAHPVAHLPRDFNLDWGFRGCRSGAPLRGPAGCRSEAGSCRSPWPPWFHM